MRSTENVRIGETFKVPDYTGRVPEGKKFVCWNTKEDGTGINYRVGQKVRIMADFELFPLWGDSQ